MASPYPVHDFGMNEKQNAGAKFSWLYDRFFGVPGLTYPNSREQVGQATTLSTGRKPSILDMRVDGMIPFDPLGVPIHQLVGMRA
jgi:hypothetical protein